RVFAISCKPKKAAVSPEIVYSYGISETNKDLFFMLAHYFSNYYQKLPHDYMLPAIDPYTSELFGTTIPALHLCTELVAISTPVKNAEQSELFYWKYVRVAPEYSTDKRLPAENYQMAGWENDNSRLAGIVMFAIPEKQARQSIKLLVQEYSDEGNHIAAISTSGTTCKSPLFPEELMPALASGTLKSNMYAVADESIAADNETWRMLIAHHLPLTSKSDLAMLALLLAGITGIVILYVHRTVYAATGLSRSIQYKLICSIMLTAVVPMLTVVFVSDSFARENHRVMLHQLKLEIQRNLDTYEHKLSYDNVRVINMLMGFARNSETLKLARQLDKNPDSEETKTQLKSLFHSHLDELRAFSQWCYGTTLREAVLVSRKNWELSFSKNQSPEKKDFAKVLGQIGKHLLSQMSGSRTDDLSMQDFKSDLFYNSVMQSIKSNFGDEAYIKTTNAINQMVEFEVTTGAAGMLTTPMPSIKQPEFMIVWLTEQRRGSYFTIMAKRNKGPFAIFTVEHQGYGELAPVFKPLEGLNLEKAAAWISSSQLPVSYEQPVGKEIVSIEGRPGIKQLSNLIIGAGSQTPIQRATDAIKTYLLCFMLLAVLIFIVIGYQTAADIITPVRLLTMGMRQIGQQNYFYRIALDRSDELGQLCASFDHFAQGLAEKQIMGKMLSRSAQKAMAEKDSTPDLLGKRKGFVFVFIGSLNFAEKLSHENTETLFARIKEQSAVLCRCIIEQGGDIDKLMGDKILGIFEAEGAPQAEAARQSAIEAAQRIMQAEQAGELHFPVAIGVNAGTVISGMLGFGAKRDFTVIGDAVNVSARIEKEAEKLPEQRCLFSHDFVSGLSDATRFNLHSEAALKGKAATLKLYRLT
ncbi:MAG: adenylate/guanylate cyclase domain-containing protein, partial [Candidatus Riflebacteria bacterium]|nr:adenylate/guanylate cyclase domain-containing protein [Candidatus Riflebacteria bacterium]